MIQRLPFRYSWRLSYDSKDHVARFLHLILHQVHRIASYELHQSSSYPSWVYHWYYLICLSEVASYSIASLQLNGPRSLRGEMRLGDRYQEERIRYQRLAGHMATLR